MKKQKIQMLVVVILLVICVVAYIFISKNAGKLDSTENDGPNAVSYTHLTLPTN